MRLFMKPFMNWYSNAWETGLANLEADDGGRRALSSPLIGRVKRRVVPRPGSEVAVRVPPWASTRSRAMGRPRPLPGESGER